MKSFSQKQLALDHDVLQAIKRFPKLFDDRLHKGLYALIGNTYFQFLEERPVVHLKKILLYQFFLQNKLEQISSTNEREEREIFVHVFSASTRICIATGLSYDYQSEIFNKQHILSSIETFIAGIKEIPKSFYKWHAQEHDYLFCYLEVQKLRGKDLSRRELKKLQIDLKKQMLHSVTPYCPSVFWPYNHEESYRQIFILNKEIQGDRDLPQVSIQFKGLTSTEVEFLIHMACPKAFLSLDEIMHRLPPSIRSLFHFSSDFKHSQSFAFSIFLPITQPTQSINLIMTRRSIVALLEETIGPFRDFNGGIFIKQEEAFSRLKINLGDHIRSFHFFAEKVFYSLKPIERQITLTSSEANILFTTFSSVIHAKKSFYYQHHEHKLLVIKSKERSQLESLLQSIKKPGEVSSALLQLSETYYFVLMDSSKKHIDRLLQNLTPPLTTSKKTLRIAMQLGLPPSLSPYYYYLAPDLRCRTIYKALFEGLTRLNHKGEAELAGARAMHCSDDKLIYTFTLRPNRWSNGEKVTAFHYAQGWKQLFSFDRISASCFCFLKNGEKIVEGKVPSDHLGVYALNHETLKIHLEYPDPYFLQRLSKPLFFPVYNQRKEPEIFNGPFTLYSRNAHMLVLERNPYFWNRKQVYFNHIEIRHISDLAQIIKRYNAEEIDWVGNPFVYTSKESCGLTEKLKNRKVRRPFLLYFNMQDPLLKKPSIRQALRLSIDYTLNPHFSDFISHENYVPHLDFNPSLAKRYLKASGEKKITLHLSYSSVVGVEPIINMLKKSWETCLGIQVVLQDSDWNTLCRSLQKEQFQIACCFFTPLSDDPLELLEKMELSHPLNFSQFHHKEYGKLIAQIRKTPDGDQKKLFLKKAESILNKEVPFVSLFNRDYIFTHHPSLTGYNIDSNGGVDFSYAYHKE